MIYIIITWKQDDCGTNGTKMITAITVYRSKLPPTVPVLRELKRLNKITNSWIYKPMAQGITTRGRFQTSELTQSQIITMSFQISSNPNITRRTRTPNKRSSVSNLNKKRSFGDQSSDATTELHKIYKNERTPTKEIGRRDRRGSSGRRRRRRSRGVGN